MAESSRGFGVAAGLDAEIATPLATRCQELGYDSVWSNDTPMAAGLETLAAFAEGADEIDLGVAVIAIDRRTPEEIAAKIEELGLPRERLWLGVGAGFSKKPLTAMREHLPALRDALGDVRLVLAAMGPKMCAFAGAEFDGVFFNWMTPQFAADARKHVEKGASEAGRDAPPVMGYVRTAVGDDAQPRLAKEEKFYRELHDGYKNHFERLGEEVGTVGVAEPDSEAAQRQLDEFTALDVTVVRGLASANFEAMATLAENAAP
ncbi:MAG TPA: LLM class flavin-dependent oxidoreductase [Solirubrobacterales bacterium]|nr:LLM class flavin-dependent oxidoreductase [Solirubrobacterales bacterium]